MTFASYERLREMIDALKVRINSKVAKSGDTVSGDLTVTGQLSGGKISMAENAATSFADLVCVVQNGEIMTRTAEQIKEDLGVSGGGGMNAMVENNVLVFLSGATVENNVLIVG